MVPPGALIVCLTALDPAPALPAEGSWYGGQILIADAASLALGAVAFSQAGKLHAGNFGSPALVLGLIAGGSYLLSPAVIHAFHGQGDNAARSVMFRLLIPSAAGLLALALYSRAWDGCRACAYGVVAVGAASLITPMALDAAGAREPASLAIHF